MYDEPANSFQSADDNPFAVPQPLPAEVPVTNQSPATPPLAGKLPHPHIGWALLWVLLFWVVQLLASIPVAIIAVIWAAAQGIHTEGALTAALDKAAIFAIPIGTFVSVVVALGVALAFYRRDWRIRLALRGPSPQHCMVMILLVLPLAILASETTNCAAEFLPQFNSEILGDFAHQHWALVLLGGCLFPALGEEIFCRGFLGRGLVAHHGPLFGVVGASLLFGILHIDPVQATGAFVLGLALHFAYLTTRSLIVPIGLHFLNNAFAFWTYRNPSLLPVPGLTPAPDGELEHTPASLLLAASASAICLCWLLYQSRCRWMLEEGREWTPGYVSAEEPPQTLVAQPSERRMNAVLLIACGLTYMLLIAAVIWSCRR